MNVSVIFVDDYNRLINQCRLALVWVLYWFIAMDRSGLSSRGFSRRKCYESRRNSVVTRVLWSVVRLHVLQLYQTMLSCRDAQARVFIYKDLFARSKIRCFPKKKHGMLQRVGWPAIVRVDRYFVM